MGLAAGEPQWRPPSSERLRRERELARLRLLVAAAVFVQHLVVRAIPSLGAALAAYLLLALVAIAAIRRDRSFAHAAALVGEAADIVVGVTLIHFATGPSSMLVLLVALIGAGHRGGWREAAAATGAAVALTLLAAYLWPSGSVASNASAGLVTALEECVFIGAAGATISYLIESGDRLRVESESVAAVMTHADVRLGLKHTMAVVFDGVVGRFNARRAILVVRDLPTDRVFMWQGAMLGAAGAEAIRVDRVDARTFDRYAVIPGAEAWSAVPVGDDKGSMDVIAIDAAGKLLRETPGSLPGDFVERIGPFEHLLGFTMQRSNEWTARLFLIDPRIGRRERREAVELGNRIVHRLCPAVDNASLLHRLRSRSAADERTRIARELHDGIIQSVVGIEMQLHTLAAGLDANSRPIAEELNRLGRLLRNEVLALRDMMQRMQPAELPPERLIETLSDVVQRFQYETGITARFSSHFDRVELSPRACRELTRVVQEALVNVRKHSGASKVFVQFACSDDVCRVTVVDDGRGFPVADVRRPIPRVIRDRVRLLGGEVTIESAPNQGARVAIAIPLSRGYAVTG